MHVLITALLATATSQTPDTVPTAQRELPRLAKPFQVLAKDAPISAVSGHAAPFVIDYDGDGKRDLVLGMYGNDQEGLSGGAARFYRNVGTNMHRSSGRRRRSSPTAGR